MLQSLPFMASDQMSDSPRMSSATSLLLRLISLPVFCLTASGLVKLQDKRQALSLVKNQGASACDSRSVICMLQANRRPL